MSGEMHPTLTGSWQGRYTYENQREECGFEAVFIEQDGAVQGSILDSGRLGEAIVTGSFTYPNLSFQKSYYNSSLKKVVYDGTMSADGKKLTGRWSIGTVLSGKWFASRQDEEELLEKIITEEDNQEELEKTKVLTCPSSR